jgi:predicted O-linked N-acetylglucosamine transferase (SPINDLY family)
MGVPVVTLTGRSFAGRHATSYLNTAGLSQFVASDATAYVELAADWSARLNDLAALRAGLREQVRRSPLGDVPAFARDFVALLRSAWTARAARG